MKEIIILIASIAALYFGIRYFKWANKHYCGLRRISIYCAANHLLTSAFIAGIGASGMSLVILNYFLNYYFGI